MTTAVFFDVDGTLIDSNDAHARCWISALAEASFAVDFATIRPLIGMGGDQLLPALELGLRADTEPGRSIEKRRGVLFSENELGKLRATPGARASLEAVRARGARVVIATSGEPATLERLLALADLGPLVDLRTTSEDAERSKPAPDIVRAALDKSGIAAADAVFVGDTRWDIDAARRAGVAVVALRSGGMSETSLAAADAVYDDPAALAAALDLPPFRW